MHSQRKHARNRTQERDDGDSLTQRILDRLEAEHEHRSEAQKRRKTVTLPQLRCLAD